MRFRWHFFGPFAWFEDPAELTARNAVFRVSDYVLAASLAGGIGGTAKGMCMAALFNVTTGYYMG